MDPIEHIRQNPIYRLDRIEKEIGMPQSHLSSALTGKRALTEKWSLLLAEYLEKKNFKKE